MSLRAQTAPQPISRPRAARPEKSLADRRRGRARGGGSPGPDARPGRCRKNRARPYKAIGSGAAFRDVPRTNADQAGRFHPARAPSRRGPTLKCVASPLVPATRIQIQRTHNLESIICDERRRKPYEILGFAKYYLKIMPIGAVPRGPASCACVLRPARSLGAPDALLTGPATLCAWHPGNFR